MLLLLLLLLFRRQRRGERHPLSPVDVPPLRDLDALARPPRPSIILIFLRGFPSALVLRLPVTTKASRNGHLLARPRTDHPRARSAAPPLLARNRARATRDTERVRLALVRAPRGVVRRNRVHLAELGVVRLREPVLLLRGTRRTERQAAEERLGLWEGWLGRVGPLAALCLAGVGLGEPAVHLLQHGLCDIVEPCVGQAHRRVVLVGRLYARSRLAPGKR